MKSKGFGNLQEFVDCVATPLVILDGEGRVAFANHAGADVLGFPVAQGLGRFLDDCPLSMQDREGRALSSADLLALAGLGHGSLTLATLAGPGHCPRWWLAQVTAGKVGGVMDGLYAVSFKAIPDFSGDDSLQAKIILAKNEWETTIDALQDIVTIQDAEMTIVRANRAAHQRFGFRLGELIGKKCHQAFFGQAAPCRGCPVRQTGEDGLPHAATIAYTRLGGIYSLTSLPIQREDGSLHRVVHVARDVTGYLRNESEKNRLMAAIEQASESVVIVDREGAIQYVNPAFEESSGYRRAEVIGKNPRLQKSGAHDQGFYREMWDTLCKKEVWRGRITNKRKNGTLYREDATISPVLDEAGEIVNFVALKRDVTREEALEQQLQQAMKMEALGTLAGGVAHDFNNILAAMLGYAEMARDRLEPNHPARKELDQVLAGGDRAVELVRQILTFSRKEAPGSRRVFKLQHLVKETVKLLRPSLPATIDLQLDIDSSCRSIFAEPGQIYQVLMNLCTNARQAIGMAHGRIAIRLSEVRDRQGAVGEERGAYLHLEISDTGSGIDPENLNRIFDPFFTTKRGDQGTGLGLAVVHGIIKKHKGEIHVESELGRGTTFHVYLAVDGRQCEPRPAASPPSPGGEERIMIVDDEVLVGRVMAGLLAKLGYQLTVYADSIEAVKAFRADPQCCDLVLTDMLMPRMTGLELAREVLALRPELPVIMVTGHSDGIDPQRARQRGLRDLILKPVRPEQLQQAVRKALDHGKHLDS